jgi:TM2 domain-containing membrane protein YozV
MRSKGTAALLAFFLGGLGAHKFYLGQGVQGFLYLLFCWTFIPAVIAFLEVFVLLSMSEHEFNLRYNPEIFPLHAAPQQIAQNVTIHIPDQVQRAPAMLGPSIVEQLKQLNELRMSGALTEAEFVAQKQRLLGQ